MKPLVAAEPQQKSDPTASVVNTSQPPITLEPLREDLRKVVLAATVVAAVATAAGPPMVPAEDPVAAAIAEAEATRQPHHRQCTWQLRRPP
jgi:hypothetical protein